MGAASAGALLVGYAVALALSVSACSPGGTDGTATPSAAASATAPTAPAEPALPVPTVTPTAVLDPETGLSCGVNAQSDGVIAQRYCGAGTVDINVGERTASVVGASCQRRGEALLVHFGTAFSSENQTVGTYLGLVLQQLPPSGQEGDAWISSLEFTFDGVRQEVADATAAVTLDAGAAHVAVHGTLVNGEVIDLVAACALD